MVGLGIFKVPFQCKCDLYSNKRYTFSPYWTCTHSCKFGCYAMKGRRWNIFGKKSETPIAVDLEKTKTDYLKLDPSSEIEISPSCDAFDLIYEKKYRITKKFLSDIVPLRKNIFLTFVTKSNLIEEYIDLIPIKQSIVQITVESYGKKIRISSPQASTYFQRKHCVHNLLSSGIQTSIRIDPIVPNFDTKEDILNIIDDFIKLGIEHITCSMLKLYPSQINKVESNLKISLKNLMYLKQEAEYFIRDNIRLEYLTLIKKKCEEYGITFAICRESLIPDTDTAFCDPFHLLSSYKPKKRIENKFYTMEDFI